MPETMTEVEIDAPDDDVFYTFGQAAGALSVAGLGTLSANQRELVDRALRGGSQLVIVTVLDPLSARGMMQLPSGEVMTLFEVRDGGPPIH